MNPDDLFQHPLFLTYWNLLCRLAKHHHRRLKSPPHLKLCFGVHPFDDTNDLSITTFGPDIAALDLSSLPDLIEQAQAALRHPNRKNSRLLPFNLRRSLPKPRKRPQ